MSILVTGGAGYIGSHTCIELMKAGYDVVIVDNLYNSKKEVLNRIAALAGKEVTFYECDIRDRRGLSQIFSQEKIEAVIHFAGLKCVPESCAKPLEYYDNNVNGTLVLCDVMRRHGCKKIVFSSSATVYGMDNISPLKEDMKTGGTTNPYGTSKFMIENILSDFYAADNDWSVCLLRYFNPIGAHESGQIGEDPNGIPNNLMPYVSQVAIGKLPCLSVYGNDYDTPDGTCIRDYIHVVDLALGHVKAVAKVLGESGLNVYNLGTGTGYSVLDVINAFEEANNLKINYKIGPRRPGDIAVCYSDPTKAYNELGWKAEKTIVDMCKDSWRWQSMNPKGYDK